jgi:hypothetical protein
MQTRVVTGLPTAHNILRKHLYLMGLIDSTLCRRCEAKEETSSHVLSGCEALGTLRHTYLGSFFLDPEDVRSLSEKCGTLLKGQGFHDLDISLSDIEGQSKAYVHWDSKGLKPLHI